MLTFEAVNTKGERLSLGSPESALLCRDAGTPADSLTLVLSCGVSDELCRVYVMNEEKEIFSGVVDEQIITSEEDVKTKLVCRSLAALLVDNEAYPCTFNDLSASLLFSRYIKPLGFSRYTGEDRVLRGEFRVSKGESCWQVLERFCRRVYGSFPVVRGDEVVMQETDDKEELVFSDRGEGLSYVSLEHNRLRCKLISKVRVKTAQGGEYTSFVTDKEALEKGVQRERFVNASDLSGKSLSDADRLIASARLKSEKLTLLIPLCMTQVLGKRVRISDTASGEHKGFYVTGIRYSLRDLSETTRLQLQRKEN